MPSGFALPKTAPFSEEDVDLLNRVVGPASPLQRAWLAGFLAGVESASSGEGEAALPSAPARPAEALRVVARFAVFFVAAFFAFAMMRVPFGC